MSTHLITGFAGKEHITSADQGSFNAAVMGGGEFVLERGEQFRCQVISNNKVRIYDGDALMQGRHIIIDRNTYEETTHDNGTQGYKRIDLIVLTYEKNAVSSVESVKLEVIKGTPAESNPTVPEYTTGDILNSGAAKNQMPLYQIPFDGLSIGEPVKLFSTVPTLEAMKTEVDEKVDEKIEEIDGKFKSMIASNAEDWGMIENYGEYSADAKTVGEEFSKLSESFEELHNVKVYKESAYGEAIVFRKCGKHVETNINGWNVTQGQTGQVVPVGLRPSYIVYGSAYLANSTEKIAVRYYEGYIQFLNVGLTGYITGTVHGKLSWYLD